MNGSKHISNCYSALQGLYWMSYGAIYTFAAVFLLDRKFTDSQVGTLIALACVFSAIFQPFAAAAADRGKRFSLRSLMTLICLLTIVPMVLLFFFPQQALSGVCYVILMLLHLAFQPLLSALGMQLLNNGYYLNFGRCQRHRLHVLCCPCLFPWLFDADLRSALSACYRQFALPAYGGIIAGISRNQTERFFHCVLSRHRFHTAGKSSVCCPLSGHHSHFHFPQRHQHLYDPDSTENRQRQSGTGAGHGIHSHSGIFCNGRFFQIRQRTGLRQYHAIHSHFLCAESRPCSLGAQSAHDLRSFSDTDFLLCLVHTGFCLLCQCHSSRWGQSKRAGNDHHCHHHGNIAGSFLCGNFITLWGITAAILVTAGIAVIGLICFFLGAEKTGPIIFSETKKSVES